MSALCLPNSNWLKIIEVRIFEARMNETKLPRPMARGYVRGRITDYTDSLRCSFQIEDGAKIGCVLISGKAKAKVLSESESQLWAVYPGTHENSLIFKVRGKAGSDKQECEGQFFVTGNIMKVKGERIFVDVWSVVEKRYFLVVVEGDITARRGQYWELECALAGDRLILVDGKKLADRLDPADYFAELARDEKQDQEQLTGVTLTEDALSCELPLVLELTV